MTYPKSLFFNFTLYHTDINECTETKPCDQTCENTEGSYICTCGTGYYLINGTQCKGWYKLLIAD